MPSAPEIPDGNGGIGEEKVLFDIKTKHFPHADGHVAVPGKVVIDLQRIADPSEPGKTTVHDSGRENRIDCDGSRICKQELFTQADNKTANPCRSSFRCTEAVVNLRGNIAPTNNRAGNELWKERNIEQQFQKTGTVFLRTAIYVNGIAQPLKSKEGYSDRKNQTNWLKLQSKKAVDIADYKIGVFVSTKYSKIQKNINRNNDPAAEKSAAEQEPCHVVEENGTQKQGNIVQVAKSIEQKTRCCQKEILPSASKR